MSVDLSVITDPVTYAYYQQEKEKIMRGRMGQPPSESSSGPFGQYFNDIGGAGSNLPDF